MRLRLVIISLCLPMVLSAVQRVVCLQQDTIVAGAWTIASGDTLRLELNGHSVTFTGTQGFEVSGALTVVGTSEMISNSSSIDALVHVAGGTVSIEGGIWQSANSNRGLIWQTDGALAIEQGRFQPDWELIRATRDTLSINGGVFEIGLDREQWLQIDASMRVGLRGGQYYYDPRWYGQDAAYGYEVYAYRNGNKPIEFYYIDEAHRDTTVLETLYYCWEIDTIWGNNHITAPGVYYDTISNRHGGDSLLILNVVQQECIDSTDVYDYETLSVCDSVRWHERWCYVSGTYYDTVPIDPYKDSIYVLSLTVFPSWRQDISQQTYVSYPWRGRVLTESGEYYDSLQSVVSGCDSIYHLSLVIKQVEDVYDTLHICAGTSYWWKGEMRSRDSLYLYAHGDSCYHLRLIIDGLSSDSVPAISLHGHRMLMVDHNSLAGQGYEFAPDDVVWYRIVGTMDDPRYPSAGNDERVGQGDFLTGDGTPLRGDYYALISISSDDACRLPLRTVVLRDPSSTKP